MKEKWFNRKEMREECLREINQSQENKKGKNCEEESEELEEVV